jgi:hypothetical protein
MCAAMRAGHQATAQAWFDNLPIAAQVAVIRALAE